MKLQLVEQAFQYFDETATLIAKKKQISYLEGLIETTENIYDNALIDDYDEKTTEQLMTVYQSIREDQIDKDVLQKAFQFAVLKGMNEQKSFNYEPTPEAVGLLMAYLLQRILPKEKRLSLLDLTVGTGNLVFQLKKQLPNLDVAGIDADPLLLRLAYVQANLAEVQIELFHQDSVMPLYKEPVDVICSDLPIGYYPDKEVARSFKVKAGNDDYTYIHHLLIEQSLHYLKEDGYAFFLIPNHLFVSEQAVYLKKMIEEEAIIYSVLQLPLSLFKEKQQARSILFLRKKNKTVKKPKQTLVASLPTFNNKEDVREIMKEINKWIEENKDCFDN